MVASVAVPLWAFVILAALAGWAVLVLLLVPGMRWFFRRRINAVIRQIGGRLNIELPSFKLTRRQVLIDRLFHDPKVQAAAAAHASANDEALADTWRRVDRYAREIVPSFNAYLYYRFGYTCVNFGAPISMRAYAREHGLHFPALDDRRRPAEVEIIAARLMNSIGRVIPVLPVSLVASVLARDPSRALSELELKSAAHEHMQRLEAAGGHLYIPRQDRGYAFEVGLRMLVMRRIVVEEEGLFRPASTEIEALDYYANAISHLAGAPAPGELLPS